MKNEFWARESKLLVRDTKRNIFLYADFKTPVALRRPDTVKPAVRNIVYVYAMCIQYMHI